MAVRDGIQLEIFFKRGLPTAYIPSLCPVSPADLPMNVFFNVCQLFCDNYTGFL